MKTLNISFIPESSLEQRVLTLSAFKTIPKIVSAELLKPDAKNPLLLEMAFIQVEDSGNLEDIIEYIKTCPYIKYVGIPPLKTVL